MQYILGIEVKQYAKNIIIYQQNYAIDILKRFNMDKCKPTKAPIEIGPKLTKQDGELVVDSILYIQACR